MYRENENACTLKRITGVISLLPSTSIAHFAGEDDQATPNALFKDKWLSDKHRTSKSVKLRIEGRNLEYVTFVCMMC